MPAGRSSRSPAASATDRPRSGRLNSIDPAAVTSAAANAEANGVRIRCGLPHDASNQYQTVGLLLYQQGWSFGQLGVASATAYSMFMIILLVATANGLLATGRLTRPGRGRGNAR